VVGTIIGWQVGLSAVAATRAGRLLPQPAPARARIAVSTWSLRPSPR
jgi:hypothetical protein